MARKKRGTVYKFRDKYRAMYSAPDGSKPSSVFDDPVEADKWLTARLAEIDQGLYTVPSDMTFRIWGEKWLETYASANNEPSTVEEYHLLIRRHTEPIKDMIMSEIEPMDIQSLYNTMMRNGMKGSSCQRLHAILRSIFRDAKDNNIVSRNIMLIVKRPKAEAPPIRFLSPEELILFMDAAKGEKAEIAVWIAAYTGIRSGEALALRWENIDLDNGLIHIVGTLKKSKAEGWKISKPKTPSSLRTIPIHEPLIGMLKEYKEKWEPNYWGLLTIGKQGRPLPKSSLTLSIKRIREKAGLNISFHGLRHSVASMLVSANTGITDVQSLLGHANPNTTLKIYSHAQKTAKKITTEKVADILNKLQ